MQPQLNTSGGAASFPKVLLLLSLKHEGPDPSEKIKYRYPIKYRSNTGIFLMSHLYLKSLRNLQPVTCYITCMLHVTLHLQPVTCDMLQYCYVTCRFQ